MSKLIYSPSSISLEGTYTHIKDADQAVNSVYYSIAFTGDGYLYTHGKKFRLFNVINDSLEGLLLNVQNGMVGLYMDGTSLGSGVVVQGVANDGVITTSTSNGIVTIGHSSTLTELYTNTTYGSSTTIPIITVNAGGHITSIQNSGTIDVSKISAEATTTTGNYHPVGVLDNTLLNPLYHNSFYFDGAGNVYANNYYLNGSTLSELYAPLSHLNSLASDSNTGHVILFDGADLNKTVNDNVAATPKAVYDAIQTAETYSLNLFAALDAMVFIGTISADGTITSHNDNLLPAVIDNTTKLLELNYKVGWTLRFVSAGTYNNLDVEIGDMIIAVKKKGNEFNINDWTIIQTNITGALTATSNLNGLLYANNSRIVQALSLSLGVLKYNGSSLQFVNQNTLWRDIQVNGTSIGTNVFNIKPGNNVSFLSLDGELTINADASDIIATASALNIEKGQVKFSYFPSSGATLTVGDTLDLSRVNNNYILSHATGSKITNKFGYITTDNYGHITNVSEVSSLPNEYSLVFKVNNSDVLEYNGSTAKAFVFLDGTDIGFTSSTDLNSNIVITPSITHRYRAVQFFPNSTSSNAIPLLSNDSSTIFTLIGGNNVTITKQNALNEDLPNGTIMINADDTWRDVLTYKFQTNLLALSSIGSTALKFNNDFLYSNEELGIMWTEIDEDNHVTYVK